MNGDHGWRWANVPVPEPHVAGLLVGFALNALRRRPLAGSRRTARIAGWSFVALGSFLAAWAVSAAGSVDVERPDALVTRGPYAFGRNPMYVGWTAVYAGVALVANAAWPLVLLPAVLAATHRAVRREERELERTFGEEYLTYRETVPRYL